MSNPTAFEALMHEVCVEKVWYGSIVNGEPAHVTDFLPDVGEVTADQFAAWVFKADGVDPEEDRAKWQSHFADLHDAFVRHMGAEKVRAEQLMCKDS